MKTILITGINGFLGSNLAKRLSKNYKIIGTEFSLENLFRIGDYNFPIYNSNQDDIQKLFKDNIVDFIIHTATFYGRNNENLKQVFETNFEMPFQLLDTAIKNGVKVLINTDTVLDRFVSSYALTKSQFRDWIFFRKNEIKIINMQLEHFYGPGASTTNFITAMIHKLIKDESKIDLTKGEQERDFIYYTDVIDAYEKVINNIESVNDSYSTYQVCSEELVKIKDLMILLKKLTKSKAKLNFGALAYRENEIMNSDSTNGKLKKLGWLPKVNLFNGLKIIIEKELETMS